MVVKMVEGGELVVVKVVVGGAVVEGGLEALGGKFVVAIEPVCLLPLVDIVFVSSEVVIGLIARPVLECGGWGGDELWKK